MSAWRKVGWLGLGAAAVLVAEVLLVLLLRIDTASRPPAPPEDGNVPFPFGALDPDALPTNADAGLQRSLAESFGQEQPGTFDPDRDGVREYALLALSGGGSNGAFGAGLLCGWSKAGTRPDFKVVTGVSTGALQATFALLGRDYDRQLRDVYVNCTTEDIYQMRGMLAGLLNDAIADTAPLAELIARHVDPELLEAVAERHRTGHRLFVGTTNMDTREFVIWDMGAIASSGRPDAVEQYRKVLLASCSVPVLMPPVYFKVGDGPEARYEMHVDGGANAQVFFRGFMLDFDDAFAEFGLSGPPAETRLFVIRNGKLVVDRPRENLPPRALALATATINHHFTITLDAALYRMYVLAHRYDMDFNLAQIPPDSPLELDSMVFDPEGMRALFELGYELALSGYDWQKHPSGLDPDERYDEGGS
jgi:predicted acylesterase/phospholipase RssA